jgi:CHAD domain-containing protein
VSTKEKKGDSPLDPEQPYRDAMRELIGRRWAAVWKAVPVALAGEDIEGVHDVRVASRRLRAAMDVAAECFPPRWYAPLHRTAKEITGALGEVRDRDVMIDYLSQDRDAAPEAERPGIDRLIGRIERERTAARVAMESYLTELLAGGVADESSRRFARHTHERDGAPNGNGAEALDEMEPAR